MPLKLRPAGLGSGIDKDRPDYAVFTGGWEIGRIYQTRGGPDSLRWFWSMTANGPMTRADRVATLEEAKAQFQRRPISGTMLIARRHATDGGRARRGRGLCCRGEPAEPRGEIHKPAESMHGGHQGLT
jgi:hypothetical protein